MAPPPPSCSSKQVCNGGACSAGHVRCGNQCVPTGQCPACGNGGGACNTADLGGASRSSLGFGSGTLLCDPTTCTFDSSMCMGGGTAGGGTGSGGTSGGGTGG